MKNQQSIKEEDDQDEDEDQDLDEYEARSILSPRYSSRTLKPNAKKRKRDEASDEEQIAPRRPMTRARAKAKSSTPKPNLKNKKHPTPGPSNTAISAAPQLDLQQTPSMDRDFRVGKYFSFGEGLTPQLNAALEEMCCGMQEIARMEYQRGRRDEREVWENGEREVRKGATRSKKIRHARDESDDDTDGSEGKVKAQFSMIPLRSHSRSR